MAAISIAILLDFLHAFARIHPFDPGASYGFPMEMDMKIATRARSIGIATALFASALAAGPAATAHGKQPPPPPTHGPPTHTQSPQSHTSPPHARHYLLA